MGRVVVVVVVVVLLLLLVVVVHYHPRSFFKNRQKTKRYKKVYKTKVAQNCLKQYIHGQVHGQGQVGDPLDPLGPRGATCGPDTKKVYKTKVTQNCLKP